jgi:hypothetical protein
MSFSVPTPDTGIDLSLHDVVTVGSRRIESGYRVDVQAKSTTLARLDATHLRHDLDVATYETLRYAQAGCPRLLVVLALPEDEARWLEQSEQELLLRRAAYWRSLRGSPATTNRKSVRVAIPRTNLFTVQALLAIMNRIKAGTPP